MSRVLKSPLAVPLLALGVAMISVQIGATFAKRLMAGIGPEAVTSLRLSFATLMMFAIWRPRHAAIDSGSRRLILGYGVSLGLMNLLFYGALSRIPLGITVALEFTGPLALALLESRRRLDYVWIALAAAGVWLLLPIEGARRLDLIGVIMALGAAVCWALYIVLGKKSGSAGRGQTVAFGALVGAIVVAPFGVAHATIALLSVHVLGAAALIAAMSSAIPYSLEMIALTRMPTKTFGILMSADPVVGAMAGYWLLGERLAPAQLLAVAMIVVASIGAVAGHGTANPDPI